MAEAVSVGFQDAVTTVAEAFLFVSEFKEVDR
jgi:hypothetical protein